MAETNRIAQPPRNQTQLNVVTFAEADFETEDEEDDEEYAYVQTLTADAVRRPGRPKKSAPYSKERPKQIKQWEEKIAEGEELDELFEEQIKEIVQMDTPMTESIKEQKLQKSKKYHLNVWEEVSKMTIPVQVGQLAEIPTFRQQMRKGLSETGPSFEIVEINQVTEGEYDEEEDDDRPKKSSAYTQCQVEGHTTPCIIDIGAGGYIISKIFLDLIGWQIDSPTKQTLIVANRYAAVPLGRVHDLPICFGKLIIPTTAVVVDTTSYDLVIGNTWLTKSKAIVDRDFVFSTLPLQLHFAGSHVNDCL